MKRQLPLIVVVVVLATLFCSVRTLPPKQKGFVPGSAGAFSSSSIEEIMVYSDLNRDGRIDVVTKSANLKMTEQFINFYVWNQKLKEFQLWATMNIDYVALHTVLVSSFKLLEQFHLVLFFNPIAGNPSIKIVPFVCADYSCSFDKQFPVPEINSRIDASPPSLVGIMGNIGLLFHTKGVVNVLQFELNDTLSYNIAPLSESIQNGTLVTNFTHSYNGDYDGDCITDLILLKPDPKNQTDSILQLIQGTQTNQYKFFTQVKINQTVQHFTFQDINFDGKNDLILLLKGSVLQIHYHTHGSDKKLCNGVGQNEFPYDQIVRVQDHEEASLIQRVQLGRVLCPNALILFGDYNNDGYEDLSITFRDSITNLPQSHLLQNQPCIGASCGTYNSLLIEQSSTLNLRTFSIKPILGSTQVSSKLSFIDIQQDGHLDFMFHLQVADPSGIKYTTIQPVYNNVDYDAFFLMITILTSIDKRNDAFSNTEYIGGVASFYVTLLSGELAPRTGNQLSQTGNSLQLPQIRQGLGRTNNYLEDLTITVPRNPYSQFKWSPIIPNSDILIVPPPVNAPTQQWLLFVMIEPTQKMASVLLLVIVSLGILGVVILRLSSKEKQEDKETQQSFYTLLR